MKLPSEELYKLVAKKIEYAGVINTRTGMILKLQRGNQTGVTIPNFKSRRNLVAFHTHPDSSFLSNMDVADIIIQQRQEILANRRGVFLVRPINRYRVVRLLHEAAIKRKKLVSW